MLFDLYALLIVATITVAMTFLNAKVTSLLRKA